jgi:hypothetical protein
MRSFVWVMLAACGSIQATIPDSAVSGDDDAPTLECGARGNACCTNATCNLRASCDGRSCIAADVWAGAPDGTFDFNGGSWIHPLVMGSTAQLPGVKALWGTTSTFVVGVGTQGLALRFDGTNWVKDVAASSALGDLNAVAGASATDVWAVGANHVSHFDGTGWLDFPPPNTNDEPLFAVWMSGPGAGWACGQAGQVWQLTGTTWAQNKREGNAFDKNGLWGSGPNDVWMVGERHSLATGLPLAIEHFDGKTWSDGAGGLDPNGALPALSAVWGLDANHVWAVGGNGTVVFWNGQLWTSLLSQTTDNLVSVWGSGANDVWVAGTTAMHHFDGTVWEAIPGLTSAPVAVWLSAN